jgi:acyl-CoA-binding protein
MTVSECQMWKAWTAIGLLASATFGCSMSRPSMADRATSLERASVDQFDDEANFKTASSGDASNSRDGVQSQSSGRKKLAAWQEQRGADGQSIPLARTDQAESVETNAEDQAEPKASRDPGTSRSPFEQAVVSGRRTKPRIAKTDASSTGLGLKDENPFED